MGRLCFSFSTWTPLRGGWFRRPLLCGLLESWSWRLYSTMLTAFFVVFDTPLDSITINPSTPPTPSPSLRSAFYSFRKPRVVGGCAAICNSMGYSGCDAGLLSMLWGGQAWFLRGCVSLSGFPGKWLVSIIWVQVRFWKICIGIVFGEGGLGKGEVEVLAWLHLGPGPRAATSFLDLLCGLELEWVGEFKQLEARTCARLL